MTSLKTFIDIMTDIKMLTTGLGLTALAVGGIIIGKKYYRNYLANSITNTLTDTSYTEFQKHLLKINKNDKNNDKCFVIDRLIDADCNGMPLSIGVNSRIDPNNILSHQGIRLGNYNERIKKLISFIKVDNGLVYEFEDNVKLTLTINDKTGAVMYSFKSPEINVVKEMPPALIKAYKTIAMTSAELDNIENVIKESRNKQLQ